MNELTIDTQILLIGSGKSNIQCVHCCELLAVIANHESLIIAIDDRGHIASEYSKKLGSDPGCLAKIVLAKYASSARLRKYKWQSSADWKPIRLALEKVHFDTGDYAFVRTAMATESRGLVAGEDDYSKRVRMILKSNAKINLVSAFEAKKSVA